MTDRELMQQALEALLEVNYDQAYAKEVAALRERLAQPEPPVLTGIDCSCGKKWRILNNTLTASEPETVMAEYKHQTYAAYKTDGEMKIGVVPEQEQAMLDAITGGTGVMLGGKRIDPSTIYKEPEQEPVWIQPNHLQKARQAPFLCRVEPKQRDDFVPIYTTPPQRKPLTDEEIEQINASLNGKRDLSRIFARAIEAAHGIKGEA